MHTVSQALATTVDRDVSLEIYSRVIAEWELNSYYEPEVTGSDSTDEELFPIESIAMPRRPKGAGSPKLIVGQSRVTDTDTWPKYRAPSATSTYKYYHSANTSSNGGVIGYVTAAVEYDEPAPCNKLVIGFETSFAYPTNVIVEVNYSGFGWFTLGNYTPDDAGVIALYRDDLGNWSEDEAIGADPEGIQGARITVTRMNTVGAGVSIIQLSPRLTMDLTDRVFDVSIDRVRDDISLTNPIGTAASSTANISMSNDDRLFDVENQDSIIHRLIDRNVKFEVADVVVRSDGVHEAVPQGTFFADEWSPGSDGTASVSCSDRSKFLQEEFTEKSFFVDKTAEHIIKDMIERFGHLESRINYTPEDAGRKIPYVFFNDDETVWSAMTSLAEAEQASFYFDEYDVFVWESRDWLFQSTTSDLLLRSNADGLSLPNLVEWSPSFEIGANRVNVKYTPLAQAKRSGDAVNNVVWEHSGELVLNASPLRQNLSATATTIHIPEEDHDYWNETGIVNIDGEYISYTKSDTPGELDIDERGLYGSEPKNHRINPIDNFWQFYTIERHWQGMRKHQGNSSHGRHLVRDSFVELETPGDDNWTTAQFTGGSVNDSYALYGCEFVFPLSTRGVGGEPYYNGEGIAGMFIHNSGTWDGYFVELVTSQFSISGSHVRANLRVWRRNGSETTFIGEPSVADMDIYPNVGRTLEVIPGRRYRLEILVYEEDGNNIFNIRVNGQGIMGFTDDADNKRTSGYWGVFTRAKTVARFDAAWAIDSTSATTDIANVMDTVIDRVYGGYNSGTLENAWAAYNRRYADVVFEDFGPIVHGGMEFDVDYEISPNVSTSLFVSNDQDIVQIYHDRDPFGSRFALMNSYREDAVVVGSDPSRDNQQMSLFAYGYPILAEDENTVTREHMLARRRRGLEELEINSPWIQTEQRAERIADWVVTRWGESNDIVQAEIIVTPQTQLGDVVAVDSPEENLTPSTHRYHVVGIDKAVGSEHSMTLTLRRFR